MNMGDAAPGIVRATAGGASVSLSADRDFAIQLCLLQ